MWVVASSGASRAASSAASRPSALRPSWISAIARSRCAPLLLGVGGDGGVGRLQRALGVVELELGERDQAVQLRDLRLGGDRAPEVLERLLRALQVEQRERALDGRLRVRRHSSLCVRM